MFLELFGHVFHFLFKECFRKKERAEDGNYWIFLSCIATRGKVCLLSLCYGDGERDWAMEVFRSIRHQED